MKTKLTTLALSAACLATPLLPAMAGTVQPPAQNLKVWMTAETGVATNVDGTITAWSDQAPTLVTGGLAHDATPLGTSAPILTQRTFASGTRAVVRFDGASGFALHNFLDATTPSVSVYVVGSVSDAAALGTFLGNTRPPFGYYLGVNATNAARWHTGEPEHDLLSITPMVTDQPYLIESTFKDTTKALYLDGTLQASVSGQALTYATWAALTIGAWGTFPAGSIDDTNLMNVTLSGFLTGDVAEILLYDSVNDAQRLAVEAYIYQKYFTVPTGAPSIDKQPLTQQVDELQPVTFAVNADGAQPLTYYWYKDGTLITGVDGPIYTLQSASRTDGGQYTVVVSNSINSVTSQAATLTVIPDTTPPTILSADRDFINPDQVMVVFSKPVAAPSATTPDNYTINNGVIVSGAAFGATPNTIILTTSDINYGPAYTLTVNQVQDLVGNVITPNSTHALAVPDPDALIPTFNLKLWLRADVGVTTDESGFVTAWNDHQVGSPPKNGTPIGLAPAPYLSQGNFPNGLHPVIQFDGFTDGFDLDNGDDMQLTDMTLYIVLTLTRDAVSQIFLGNYRDVAGWGLGISDNGATPNRVKWFTAPPNSMEPEGATLPVGTPVMLTATYSSAGGIKALYVGTNRVGQATGVPLVYASGTKLTAGYLQGNRQWTSGDIAEIIAYSEVSTSQQALVWSYLNDKYLGIGTGPVVIRSQPKSLTVAELQPATFEVGFKGASPVNIQWYRNNEPIGGATSPVYTIPLVFRTNQNAEFKAVLQNSFNTITSSVATLTVILDTNAPVVLSGTRDYLSETNITVLFSKVLNGITVSNLNNYTIEGGVTVNQAILGADQKTVFLISSDIPAGSSHTLTVNGIEDLVGNSVALNSKVPLAIPAAAVLPMTNNLVLWLAADSGIITDADGKTITDWIDRAAMPNEHDSHFTLGKPQLALADFPSGVRPVTRYDGGSGFILDNPQDFDLQSLSITVVGSTTAGFASEEFIAHWPGWAFGISDGIPGQIKWVNNGPGGVESLEPGGASLLTGNVYYIITGTIVGGGQKQLFVNGDLVSSVANAGLSYGAVDVTVGMLFWNGAQLLHGDIAEILVYSDVSEAQRTSVESYLRQKYFVPAFPEAPTLTVVKQGNSIIVSWPAASAGYSLRASSTLGPTASWAPAPEPVVVVGDQNTVTITVQGEGKYYRLQQ